MIVAVQINKPTDPQQITFNKNLGLKYVIGFLRLISLAIIAFLQIFINLSIFTNHLQTQNKQIITDFLTKNTMCLY